MQKAFIFDMDGVLINDETLWDKYEVTLFDQLFGKEIASQIRDTVGISSRTIFAKAKSLGFSKSIEETFKKWDDTAFDVYDKSNITPGVDKLGKYLVENDFKLGIVSSSRMSWIERVLPRLSFKNNITNIISLAEREDLGPKPSPDGYLEMMRVLKASPENTIILEDSNSGIRAAVDAKAYVISFSQNLIPGYKQIEISDAKAKDMREVTEIIKKWLRRH